MAWLKRKKQPHVYRDNGAGDSDAAAAFLESVRNAAEARSELRGTGAPVVQLIANALNLEYTNKPDTIRRIAELFE